MLKFLRLICSLMPPPNLVLASSSPRRKELLGLGRAPFRVVPAEINEEPLPGEQPPAYVHRLSREKGKSASGNMGKSSDLVVSADSTVIIDGKITGKPVSASEATRILKSLRGRTHLVYSAVTLTRADDGAQLSDLAVTEVPMRNYTDGEIDAYVASGDPLDKAGAYAIQHADFHPVESMSGCLANVIGLPLCHLQRTLRKWGAGFEIDIAAECQKHLQYDCPVAEKILAWEL